MNPHLEAAARALSELDGFNWEFLNADAKHFYYYKVSAALRAMREVEPTDAMREAIYAWIRTAMDTDELWRALLGAIVDQGGE